MASPSTPGDLPSRKEGLEQKLLAVASCIKALIWANADGHTCRMLNSLRVSYSMKD